MTKKRRNIDPYLEEEIFSFENDMLCVKVSDEKKISFVDDIEDLKQIRKFLNKSIIDKRSRTSNKNLIKSKIQ